MGDASGKRIGGGSGGDGGKSIAAVERQANRQKKALEQQRKAALAAGNEQLAKSLLKRQQAVGRMKAQTIRNMTKALKEAGVKESDMRYVKVDRSIRSGGRLGHDRAGGVGQYRTNTERQTSTRIKNITENARKVGLTYGNMSAKSYIMREGMRDRRLKGVRVKQTTVGAQNSLKIGTRTKYHSYAPLVFGKYSGGTYQPATKESRAKANANNKKRLQAQQRKRNKR